MEHSYQVKILGGITQNHNNMLTILDLGVGQDHFDDAGDKNYFKMVTDFFKLYKTSFTDASFIAYLNNLVDDKKIKDSDKEIYLKKYVEYSSMDVSDVAFFMDEVIDFIQTEELKNLIAEKAGDIAKGEGIKEFYKAVESISVKGMVSENKPIEYYSTYQDRIKRREDGIVQGISTGIDELDECLFYNGWAPKEMYLMLGAAKAGKTNALLFFAQVASKQGYNVVYFTCEVSAQVLSDRLDASVGDVYLDELEFESSKIAEELEQYQDKSVTGNLFISDHPTKSLTVSRARRIIQDIEREEGVKLHMAVFDYGDIMKPEVLGDKRDGIGDIFERIRGLAGEFDMACLSGTQLNREGSKKNVAQGTDIAEDWSKIMTADAVIGINASDQEKSQNIMRVSIVENRNGPKKVFKIKTAYAKARFFDEFFEFENYG